MNFTYLARILVDTPELASVLTFDDAVKYVDLVRCLKPSLRLLQPSYDNRPPAALPNAPHDFLKVCLGVTDEVAKLAWATFRQLAWDNEDTNTWEWDASAHAKYAALFLEHGLIRGVSMWFSLPDGPY
jgi:hypothetical protein